MTSKYVGFYRNNMKMVDPGTEINCFVCQRLLKTSGATMISFGIDKKPEHSYFFRVHVNCWDTLQPREQDEFIKDFRYYLQ